MSNTGKSGSWRQESIWANCHSKWRATRTQLLKSSNLTQNTSGGLRLGSREDSAKLFGVHWPVDWEHSI